ncbi:MAG: 4Fe-4S cluster-binding domain-containing protein [Candidatus Helarchaeota archaeon]|nr:4Fe-4S cluster-binding domain-containing protein [Candidatus Helarchaeota archaeon]
MNITKIPTPISGGVILSYKCSAECRHCMYICSPKWNADWISESDLEKGLSQLVGNIKSSPYGNDVISLNHGLHFTGGEPFLNFNILLRAVEISDKLNIPSTFVETNCYWCKDDKITREKLEILKEKGLKGILISVNPFFAEYIPFERTERCICISKTVFGENVLIYQNEYYRLFKILGIKEKISIEDFLKLTKNEYFIGKVELFFMGRAIYRLKNFFPTYPVHVFFNIPCQPLFLRDWHNHFDNYGNFMPGYCGGISLGNWQNLQNLLENGINLEDYPILRYLIANDMEGLFKFAVDFGYVESQSGYLSKCDLCLDIRKHLISKQNFDELKPKDFYIHS